MASDILLIGIDGGATEAKSHEVLVEGDGLDAKFTLGERSASARYERIDGFAPVPVGDQIAQRNAGKPEVTDAERAQGAKYTDAAAATVGEIADAAGAERVLIGMGMPGLKTDDGRGINAINNGARTPTFVSDLEAKLRAAGLDLVAPIARLGSDADYCGVGEEHAADGAFRGVRDAYYIGCGTGVADALKLGGALTPLDATKPWLMKSWQIPSSLGPTFEKIISANAMMTLYASLHGTTAAALVEKGVFPQDDAAKGDAMAMGVMTVVAMVLAEAIFERLHTIHAGRADAAHRGEAYLTLTPDHPHRGTLLSRVVIGQRFGTIWSELKYRKVLNEPCEKMLVELAENAGDAKLLDHIVSEGKVRPGLLVPSKLREAPAIGAAIDAWRAWKD